ncbi:phosphatidylinositol 3-kinase catalytic subunit type 3 [Anaeramoeba ignava]|uniref:phosphatidylinositol 3-kinase n=1 Tax=Anaeramoeba ignava TaxID=1746090 RepID=A0A9Q0LTW5_ANAIG|nr:phosphatidylinositol 3-kinase catalytic subunit type 3 [Anaeramoeba ignava]
MMNNWNVDTVIALELISKKFKNQKIRQFGVEKLDECEDKELILYLLQVVQGLRYEESEKSPLTQFLIRRSLQNPILGVYFYWYVGTERNDKKFSIFAKVHLEFARQCLESEKGKVLLTQLQRQEKLIQELGEIAEKLKSNSKLSRPKKITFLKEMLQFQYKDLLEFQPLLLPLDPHVSVIGIKPENVYIFKSNLYPMKIVFREFDSHSFKFKENYKGNDKENEKENDKENEYGIIYKMGDDIRQDNLVMQLIILMEQLLKKENLDLKLTPYHVLPTSSEIGIVQFVKAKSLASILGEFDSLSNFFIKFHPDNNNDFGFEKDVMSNYIKSCAGYCIITYILGVGDRHLDNLMLTQDGKLIHIDFGYILGHDPKPFPPPMKLCKEMVDVMGGLKSEYYQEFKRLSAETFIALRRHSHLIVNLLMLMIDANIPDIDRSQTSIVKVHEKFSLHLNDEKAKKYISAVIDESVNALFPQVVETIHKWAQYWRS